jgi:Polyketide cyclase / dehydrase and lipid transport
VTAHLRVEQEMPRSSAEVFAVLHDYHRRLEWDTLLQRAETRDDMPAGKGVLSTCQARRSLGGLVFKTEYKAYDPPSVAAVKLVDPPRFFASWGASIRHTDLPGGGSMCTYTMTFVCKPRWAAPLVERVAALAFRWETRRRLRALAHYLGR